VLGAVSRGEGFERAQIPDAFRAPPAVASDSNA
jgi:hypothetical protein